MKKIVLLCEAGITTSMLTQKLEEIIKEKAMELEIMASPIAEVASLGDMADMLVLSPQVRFNYAKIQQMFPDKIIIKISEEDYNNLHVKKIVDEIVNHIDK